MGAAGISSLVWRWRNVVCPRVNVPMFGDFVNVTEPLQTPTIPPRELRLRLGGGCSLNPGAVFPVRTALIVAASIRSEAGAVVLTSHVHVFAGLGVALLVLRDRLGGLCGFQSGGHLLYLHGVR